MNIQQLDEVLHAYGWYRPYPSAPADNNLWCVAPDPDTALPDVVDKAAMISTLDFLGIKPQFGDWGLGTQLYITLP